MYDVAELHNGRSRVGLAPLTDYDFDNFVINSAGAPCRSGQKYCSCYIAHLSFSTLVILSVNLTIIIFKRNIEPDAKNNS